MSPTVNKVTQMSTVHYLSADDSKADNDRAEEPAQQKINPFDNPDNLVRKRAVMAYLGLPEKSGATLWRWEQNGLIPEGRYLGNFKVWRAGDIAEARERMLSDQPMSIPVPKRRRKPYNKS